MIKRKGYKTYKCTLCTAIFEIEAVDNATYPKYCPNCEVFNSNEDTIIIFEGEKMQKMESYELNDYLIVEWHRYGWKWLVISLDHSTGWKGFATKEEAIVYAKRNEE